MQIPLEIFWVIRIYLYKMKIKVFRILQSNKNKNWSIELLTELKIFL